MHLIQGCSFFQQAPYSGIIQPSHSIPFQQSTTPGTFQCNNYYPPQTTHSNGPSLSFSQPTSPPLNPNNNPESSQRRKKKMSAGGVKGRNIWTTEQDIELSVAWLKISEDAFTATNQSKDKFWERVTKKFNEHMSCINANHVERSVDACNARWRIISPAVTKWTGTLAHAYRDAPSGWNQSMIESQARNTYQQTYGEHFAFEECWKHLKDSYKWQTWSKRKSSVGSAASGPSASSKRKYVQSNDPTNDIRDTDVPPTSFNVDSPEPVTSRDDAPQSVLVDTPEAGACSAKSQVPPMYGPSKIKTPAGGRKILNERQRAKKRFEETQSEGAQKISAALLTVDKDVVEITRRAEEARHQRDDFMRLHLEAESTRAKEQHLWDAVSKRTAYVKDLLYVTEKLKDAYRELEQMDRSSVRTPREQFDYNASKRLVQSLESQLTVLENSINALPVESLNQSTPTSSATTVGINPHALNGETD